MEKRGPIEAGRVPFAGIPDKWKAWMEAGLAMVGGGGINC